MLPKMSYIDYNMWCSIMQHMSDNMVTGDIIIPIDDIIVLPSYPKENDQIKRPSMIVQRVFGRVDSIGMGSVLGSYTDETENRTYDVYGKEHSMLYQFIIEGDNNFQSSIITDIIVSILHKSEDTYNSSTEIQLLNFANGSKDVIGKIVRYGNVDITPLSVDRDEEYMVSVRSTFNVIQSIIDTDQQYVDLEKPLRWRISFKL